MLKPLITALIALSLICPGRADAQAQPDPDTVAAAKELVIALRLTDQFKLNLQAILQAMKLEVSQGRPEIERDFDAVTSVVLDAMNVRVDEVRVQIAGIYARNFTASDLRQLAAFYRTPLAQRFLEKTPSVMQEITTAGQNITGSVVSEMHGRLIEELRKRGQKL